MRGSSLRVMAVLSTASMVAVFGATACGGGGDDGGGAANGEKTAITVGCQPPKSNKLERKHWDADVKAFEKLHPNIDVQGRDAFPCINPDTFQAKLSGGTMEDVFYVYYTDVRSIIDKRQAADISKYVGKVGHLKELRPEVLGIFQRDGKTYGLPRNNYAMGLVYNRKLFTNAGLDPDDPPDTWAEVRTAAKRIAGLGSGTVGFGEYSAGNAGGWHFATSLYARGGDMVTPDGKKAAFNSAEGKAVLQALKEMRWPDNSMGSKQLLQWEDLMRMMGGGKLGMMLGAPDVVQQVANDFGGKYADYGVAAMPEGQASLNGGDGYMFNPKATPEKIRAGLLWLEFQNLTPGQGQFDYKRSKADGRPVGMPIPDLYGSSKSGQEITALREKYATVPVENFASFVEGSSSMPNKPEPPKAQELYAVLDKPMSAVLTRKDADVDQLLEEAESKANGILARAR